MSLLWGFFVNYLQDEINVNKIKISFPHNGSAFQEMHYL